MNLAKLFSPDCIRCHSEVGSKKRALEEIADLLVSVNPQLQPVDIFDALMERERLGTTALGKGVAIPHCRLSEIERSSLALITIDSGIDYDAPDRQPVDVIVALVVPEESTEEHLEVLAGLAELLSDPQFITRLRGHTIPQALYSDITGWRAQGAA